MRTCHPRARRLLTITSPQGDGNWEGCIPRTPEERIEESYLPSLPRKGMETSSAWAGGRMPSNGLLTITSPQGDGNVGGSDVR